MKQFSAEEKGFHGTIKAVVEIDEAKGQINKVWAENVTPNTIGAAGIATWLEKANQICRNRCSFRCIYFNWGFKKSCNHRCKSIKSA